MKKQIGMRPHDVVVLLKMVVLDNDFYLKDVADSIGVSRSEVSESVVRSVAAGLLSADKKTVRRNNLLEFLVHGIKYVFPQIPGAIVRGLPTAHSAPPLKNLIESEYSYVWPYIDGTIVGQEIQPLYYSVPQACLNDENLYQLLAVVDALRVGSARERKLAIKELEKRLCQ